MAERCEDEAGPVIQAERLIAQLTGHALGQIDLTATQIRAAEILLRRSQPPVPDGGAPGREPVTEARNVIVRARD